MSRPFFIPAPTGGLNVRDPFLLKPETDAERLDNVVCETGYVRTRGAETLFCDTGSGDVKTLASMRIESGSEVFLAISSDQNFYDITTGTASDISATYDGTAQFTDPIWQTCIYRHRIFGCNGVDRPFVWDGSGDVEIPAWTGPSDNKKLVNVQPYKSRLYFCEYGNASYWYTDLTDAVSGALIEVPLDSLLHLGGFPVFAGSSSGRIGDTSQELFVIYTTEGEVLIYQGRYPADSTWNIIKRCRIAKPNKNDATVGDIDYRCFLYIDDKLYLNTRYGPVGVHELLSGKDADDAFQIESGKVRQFFVDDARNGGMSTLVGSSCVHHPSRNYAIFNLNGSNSYPSCLVMNTITKAWSRWENVFAQCWATFNNKLYFGGRGSAGSSTGSVYEADVQFGTSAADYFFWIIEHASSFLGNAKSAKTVSALQPMFSAQKTSGAESSDSFTYGVEVDGALTARAQEVDTVATTQSTCTYQITSSTPKYNKPVVSLVGEGKSVALRLEDIPTAYDNTVVTELKYFGSWVEVTDSGGIS